MDGPVQLLLSVYEQVFPHSLLNLHSPSQADELFSLTVNIKISSFASMRAAVIYTYPMFCSYSSWASREIVCEENYMEVKVFSLQAKRHPSSLPSTATSTNSHQMWVLLHAQHAHCYSA